MAEPSASYHRGEMDIHEQQATFSGFLNLSKWLSLALAVVLVFVVLLFCTKTGFVMSLAAALVVLAVGLFALHGKKEAAH